MFRNTIIAITLLAGLTAAGAAQEQKSEIGLQGTGFFTKDGNGNGVYQRGSDSGGLLVNYRYHLNRWLAAEASYGWDRNTQSYFAEGGSHLQTDIHQATGGLIFSLPQTARFRMNPYVLAEGGALVFRPTQNAAFLTGGSTQARGTFVYGGGVNVPLSKHFSARAEYRGLVYQAPDFGLRSLRTDTWTHTAQPSLGVVFRF
jgi:opacity protein-like surface antigen